MWLVNGLGLGSLTVSCKHGNENLVFIEGDKFLGRISENKFPKMHSTTQSYNSHKILTCEFADVVLKNPETVNSLTSCANRLFYSDH